MATIKLSKTNVDRLTCPPDKKQVFLREAGGFGVRATANSKSYIFQGKLDGNVIRMTIGDVETWFLDEARKEARRLKTIIDSGRDPRIIKKEKTDADIAKRKTIEAEKLPAIELWPRYMEHCSTRQKRPWSDTYKKQHEYLVDAGGKPKTRGRKKGEGPVTLKGPLYDLLQMPLVAIDANAIEAWLKQNANRPAVAEFAYSRLRAFMNWCNKQGTYRGKVKVDAFTDDNVKDQVPELQAREDRLDRLDLKPWFQAVRELPNPIHAAYLQITLLTGCRRGELAPLKWEHVNFKHGTLILSGKTGTRTITMPPYIRSLLLDLKKQTGPTVVSMDGTSPEWEPSPYVFTSPTAESGYIQEPRYSHEKAVQAAGIGHVSIHGLRRTFGSMSDSIGVDLPHGVVLQIQGHKPQGTAERHYRVRKMEELAPWHAKYEKWILEQAGIEQPQEEKPRLKAVNGGMN